jgi:ABC-type dipeptide/oligopeptide/nickel transport system permease component
MAKFLLSRFFQLVVVVIGIATLLFLLLHLSGDPAVVIAGGESASPEVVERVRQELGLNKPLIVQYGIFVSQMIRLDFGQSYFLREPALGIVLKHLPATIKLAGFSFLLTTLISFPIGIIAALYHDSWIGRLLLSLVYLGQSMPAFWLGILLILIFSVHLQWLPSFGEGGLKHLIMPVITVSSFAVARIARLVRSGMLEVMNQDYIRTARAKGVQESKVISIHAIKNMLIPIVTVIGMQVGFMIGGAVIAETIFAYPGIAGQLVRAVSNRDYPVVQATVFLVAVSVVTANILVDISYTILDPRIRIK